jgi:hypothetical protein
MPIKLKFYQSGTLLMAAVVLVLIIVAMVTAMSFLSVSDIGASGNHMSSAQAYFISRSGLHRATFQYKSGTACDATSNQNNLAVGAGNFSTTFTAYPTGATTATLNGAITSSATTIPVTNLTNFAGHGSIKIDSETIYYSATSTQASVCGTAPCFYGATRGAAASTAAAHSSGAAVTQPSQCLIRSTGVAGAARRILESVVQAAQVPLFFLDGGSVTVGTSATNIGSTSSIAGYNPPAGTNLVIAQVSIRNTTATASPIQAIAAGNLQLKKGAAVLASNQMIMQAAGTPVSPTNEPQSGVVLLYRDAGAAANAQYDVLATANVAGQIQAEVKMLVINGVPPNSSFQDGASTPLAFWSDVSPATLLSHSSTVPAGDNVVLAAVQFDNTNTGTRSCGKKNDLVLSRGATTLWTNNMFDQECAKSTVPRRSNGYLVVARDPGAPANPTYTFTGRDANTSAAPQTNGEVKMLVINGVSSAYRGFGAQVPVTTVATSMLGGALATTFPAGANAVLGFIEYRQQQVSGHPMNSLLAGNERIVFGGATVSSNQFDLDLGFDGENNDYVDSILWGQPSAPSNPNYDLQALANAEAGVCTSVGVCARGSLVAINLTAASIVIVDTQEIFP